MTLLYPAKGFDVYAGTLSTVERQAAKDEGFEFIIHYYGGSSGKDLTAAELQLNSKLGLYTGAVFECSDQPDYFTATRGTLDGNIALAQAVRAGQPKGSCIYFAYDFGPLPQHLAGNIGPYHTQAAALVHAAGFRVGAYGAGLTMNYLFGKGLLDCDWIGGAMGWAGSRGYKRADGSQPCLLQGLPIDICNNTLNVDPDTAFRDAGLFIL